MNHSISFLFAVTATVMTLGAAPASALTTWQEFCLLNADDGAAMTACLYLDEIEGRKDTGGPVLTIKK